jgi:hypothetical protein
LRQVIAIAITAITLISRYATLLRSSRHAVLPFPSFEPHYYAMIPDYLRFIRRCRHYAIHIDTNIEIQLAKG